MVKGAGRPAHVIDHSKVIIQTSWALISERRLGYSDVIHRDTLGKLYDSAFWT